MKIPDFDVKIVEVPSTDHEISIPVTLLSPKLSNNSILGSILGRKKREN
jgi:hypothetical protein